MNRILQIDVLKGFAILLVVLGHAIYETYSENNIVFRMIYSFHMPLFMFLSGLPYLFSLFLHFFGVIPVNHYSCPHCGIYLTNTNYTMDQG